MANGERWSQVAGRTASSDGTFIYAVKTTRIFCRPICKARLPRRSNVEFFDTPAQAQAAGYRACKRCQPLLPSHQPESDKVQKACDFLESLPDDAPLPGLERLAKEAGLTKHHFHRLFKRETGLTPREYALARRRDSKSDGTASSAVTPCTPFFDGIATPAVVDDETITNAVDLDPELLNDFKLPSSQEVRDIFVYYNIVPTTYGVLLVAFRFREVCMLELGRDEQELTAGLASGYPVTCYIHLPVATAASEDAETFQQQTQIFVDALEQPCGKVIDLPLSFSLDMPTRSA